MPIDFYCETRKRFLKKATDFKNQWLSIWWAHQDLNLGPKDYEQLQEIKPITNHRVTSDLQRCGSKCGRASKITQLI